MNRNDSRLIPAVVLLATLAAAMFTGCTETPVEADYNNPLDPAGPFGGDPFNLEAHISGLAVFLTWTDLGMDDLAGYRVERRSSAETVFIEIVELGPEFTIYQDSTYAPNAPNSYRVLALDAAGNTNAASAVTPATIIAPAQVNLGGYTTAASRTVDMIVRASMGESVEVDDDPSFASPAVAPLDEAGEAFLTWDLGPAAANGEVKYIHTRVLTGGVPGTARLDSLTVDYSPNLIFAGNPATLARRTTPLAISGGGTTRMRFATDRAGLAAAVWLDAAETYTGWMLAADPDTQLVFGEFEGDFGFTFVDSALAAPDSLQHLTLVLNSGNESVVGSHLRVYINAVATEIRAAQSEGDLAVTPWEPYGGRLEYFHDGCGSDLQKTVYAQVRNDWFTSATLSGTVIWQPDQVLGAAYAGPDTVTAGTTVTLSGTAVRGTCSDPIDEVRLDAGNDWVTAVGTLSWTLEWTAPAAAGEAELRIQVIAGEEASSIQTYLVVVVEP